MDGALPQIRYHADLDQGSEEWLQARCGLLTASEMKKILTPTMKVADNDKTRAHVYELAAQRLSGYVEPTYISDDMLRGMTDEVDARLIYEKNCAPVTTMGFITNSRWGFTIGYSPDGLVGHDGLIECKSRLQKFQIQTIAECVAAGAIPVDYMLQCQTGLLVSERSWLDFISYSGGLPMVVIRVYPDDAVQSAILEAVAAFEAKVAVVMDAYRMAVASDARLFPTERRKIEDLY
jgi:hypothetical protein